jgi:hypothetical protein
MADKEKDKTEKVEQAKVAYYFDPTKANGSRPSGVPMGDILQDVYDGLPKWIQRGIGKSAAYSKTPIVVVVEEAEADKDKEKESSNGEKYKPANKPK